MGAKPTYTITLAVSGNHQVAVSGDDPAAVTEGLVWAKATYQKLKGLQLDGQPVQDQAPARISQLSTARAQQHTPIQSERTLEVPVCPIHEQPMTLVDGRKGPFWSCHHKNRDGSWCSYKPKENIQHVLSAFAPSAASPSL